MNRYTIIYERKATMEDGETVWTTYPANTKAASVAEALQNTVLHKESGHLRIISVFCNSFADDWN